MNKPVRRIEVNVYPTAKQHDRLCRYTESCECHSIPAEMVIRLVQVGLAGAVRREAIEEG